MKEMHFREGNVVLYVRERSKRYQARIKLANNKWKRISTGESDLEKASQIACEKYDEIKFKVKKKQSLALIQSVKMQSQCCILDRG